jgi:hypothetical protein
VSGAWRSPVEVERPHFSGGRVIANRPPATTDPGHERFDHTDNRSCGDRSIKGVPTVLKDSQSFEAGCPMSAADCAMGTDYDRTSGTSMHAG